MRLSLAICAGAGIAVSLSCSGGGGGTANTPTLPDSIQILVSNNFFAPLVDTVAAGGKVVWVWTSGSVGHNIVSDGPQTFPPDSTLDNFPNSHGPFTLQAGVYNYHCTAHGQAGLGMAGTIVVR